MDVVRELLNVKVKLEKAKVLNSMLPCFAFLNSGCCLRIGESDTSESESAGFPFLIMADVVRE